MAFQFGNSAMFVMGTVDQTMYKRTTGDVMGFDKLGQDVALNYNFELTEVTGSRGVLVAALPHTTRLTGTYTSAAFSLDHRANLIGSEVQYNAPVRYCEDITANGNTLTVTRTPVKFLAQPVGDTYGWCYVHVKGAATYEGKNYGVDLTTGVVQGFTAVNGTTYTVTYFIANASAAMVGMNAYANPSIVSILQRWAVYSKQGGSRENGTLSGYLNVVVPLAMLEGNAGIDGNQTTNSTTSYNWRAILPGDNLPECENLTCTNDEEYLAYYVYVPCGDTTVSVQDVVVVGEGITLEVDDSAQIPVKYIMPGDKLSQPDYSDLTFTSSATGVATVGEHTGIVSGVSAGSAVVTVSLTKGDGTVLTDTCAITVE